MRSDSVNTTTRSGIIRIAVMYPIIASNDTEPDLSGFCSNASNKAVSSAIRSPYMDYAAARHRY